MHIELVSASTTAAGAAGAAATALTGDSLTVKNGRNNIKIVSLWQTNQVAGWGQILYPSAHDTTRGFRAVAPIGVNQCMLPLGVTLDVTAQELMSVTIAGSAVGGDVEHQSMLLKYDNLPGVSQRLMTASEVQSKTKKLTTVQASIVSAAGPQYSGSELINAESDLLRANTDYAVLGITTGSACHAVTLVGPDTGNVKIGVPGSIQQDIQAGWFSLLSRALGEPMIPVINSGNKSSTYIGVACNENAGTFLVSLILAEL